MKYIGLDYGSKKCGIAVSDDNGVVAVPLGIFPTLEIKDKLVNMLENKLFQRVVVGESTDSSGAHNVIFAETEKFVNIMIEMCKKDNRELEFIFEKEFFSSKHARAEDGKREIDDRAAALILQRFLDRQNLKTRTAEEILQEYE